MPTINNWGAALAPEPTTKLAGRTAAGVSGRFSISDGIDACAVYGHCYYDNTTGTTLALTPAGTWVPFVTFTAGQLRGVSASMASTPDYLTVQTPGMYLVCVHGSVVVAGACILECGAFVNGVVNTVGCKVREDFNSSGSLGGNFGAAMPMPLSAGDQVSVWARVTDTARNATFRVMGLTLVKLGV